MKFLCICQYGHSRSVALTRGLHERGYPAVAIGVSTAGSALPVLADWADIIAVLDTPFVKSVPDMHRHKITTAFVVGPDRWVNPYHPELKMLLNERLEAYFASAKPDANWRR